MYCSKCGAFLTGKEKYCVNCGESVGSMGGNAFPSQPYRNNVRGSQQIKRTYQHKYVGVTVFQIVLLIILILFCLFLVCNKDLNRIINATAFFSGKSDGLGALKALLWFLIGCDIFICVLKILQVSVISSTHLTLSDTSVYGCGGKGSIYSKTDFSFLYRDIVQVSVQSGNLIIITSAGKVICRIENENDALMMINKMIEKR